MGDFYPSIHLKQALLINRSCVTGSTAFGAWDFGHQIPVALAEITLLRHVNNIYFPFSTANNTFLVLVLSCPFTETTRYFTRYFLPFFCFCHNKSHHYEYQTIIYVFPFNRCIIPKK